MGPGIRTSIGEARWSFPWGRPSLGMVLNRLVEPDSKKEFFNFSPFAPFDGLPLRKWKAPTGVLQQAGRYYKVTDNLIVKKDCLDGEPYIVCHNLEREEENARQRMEIIAALEAQLERGGLAGLAKRRGYRCQSQVL